MSQTIKADWKSKRTAESRVVEEALRHKFPQSDAYRYNSASIRVRVVDDRFRGKTIGRRDALVEPILNKLPREIQADIMNLLTLYPGEPEESLSAFVLNQEFEHPTDPEF